MVDLQRRLGVRVIIILVPLLLALRTLWLMASPQSNSVEGNNTAYGSSRWWVLASSPPPPQLVLGARREKQTKQHCLHHGRPASFDTPGSLPDFIVAGVHKGGSTALYGYLLQHAAVRPAYCKEVHFFDDSRAWKRGTQFYRMYFTPATPGTVTGEGTPKYIRDRNVPARVAEMLPEVRVIVTLRDPVERFVSQFVGQSQRELIGFTCKRYIEGQLLALKHCVERDLERCSRKERRQSSRGSGDEESGDGSCTEDMAHNRCVAQRGELALSRGAYVHQLRRWLKHVPAKRILLVQAERLFASTAATMQQVASFIGVRPFSAEELASFGRTHRGSNHSADRDLHDQCDRAAIRRFFKPQTEQLLALLNETWPRVLESWVPWKEDGS